MTKLATLLAIGIAAVNGQGKGGPSTTDLYAELPAMPEETQKCYTTAYEGKPWAYSKKITGIVPTNDNGEKVTICHGTASETNPYVDISVDIHGAVNHLEGGAQGHNQANPRNDDMFPMTESPWDGCIYDCNCELIELQTPTITAGPGNGDEDTAIAIAVDATLNGYPGAETLEVYVKNVPAGATVSNGNAVAGQTGVYKLDSWDSFSVTPPHNSDVDFDLEFEAVSFLTCRPETTLSASTTSTVTVIAVADAPRVTVSDADTVEDHDVELTIVVELTDTDGSESLSGVTISDVPDGSSFDPPGSVTAGAGTFTVYFTAEEAAAGISYIPIKDSDVDVALSVSASSTESSNSDTATGNAASPLAVAIEAEADTPAGDLGTRHIYNLEDAAFQQLINSFTSTDVDGSEYIRVVAFAEGHPGVQVSVNGQALEAGPNGKFSLTSHIAADGTLPGLQVTYPDFSGEFTMSYEVTAHETNNPNTVAKMTFHISHQIRGVADVPSLTAHHYLGTEQVGKIFFPIDFAATDTDGSETATLTISNVPDNVGFYTKVSTDAGYQYDALDRDANGNFVLSEGQQGSLFIDIPEGQSGSMFLVVGASALESDQEGWTPCTPDVPLTTMSYRNTFQDCATPEVAEVVFDDDIWEEDEEGTGKIPEAAAANWAAFVAAALERGDQNSAAGSYYTAGDDKKEGFKWDIVPTQHTDLCYSTPSSADDRFSYPPKVVANLNKHHNMVAICHGSPGKNNKNNNNNNNKGYRLMLVSSQAVDKSGHLMPPGERKHMDVWPGGFDLGNKRFDCRCNPLEPGTVWPEGAGTGRRLTSFEAVPTRRSLLAGNCRENPARVVSVVEVFVADSGCEADATALLDGNDKIFSTVDPGTTKTFVFQCDQIDGCQILVEGEVLVQVIGAPAGDGRRRLLAEKTATVQILDVPFGTSQLSVTAVPGSTSAVAFSIETYVGAVRKEFLRLTRGNQIVDDAQARTLAAGQGTTSTTVSNFNGVTLGLLIALVSLIVLVAVGLVYRQHRKSIRAEERRQAYKQASVDEELGDRDSKVNGFLNDRKNKSTSANNKNVVVAVE